MPRKGALNVRHDPQRPGLLVLEHVVLTQILQRHAEALGDELVGLSLEGERVDGPAVHAVVLEDEVRARLASLRLGSFGEDRAAAKVQIEANSREGGQP